MRIQSVRIRNFRALENVEIAFDTVTTFIGPNGTGKSTALRALEWFFNGKPGSLNDEDCAFGAVADIEVQVTFSDLTSKDREALTKYTPPRAATFTAWKIRRPDGSETMSANAKSFAAFNDIRASSAAAEKKKLYVALRAAHPELELPAASTSALIDEAMTTWESAHTEQLTNAPEGLPTNFFGFNSNGKMSGLFDFVLVTADLRASEESLDGKASIIGRILERSVDRTAADEAIATIVEESRARQQQVYTDKFQTQLVEVKTKLDEVVARYSPGRTITVKPSEVELKAPRTTFEVAVLDGNTETKVDRQGHGFQRTLLISALQVLAESGAASAEGSICLAIEEPELFQHPIQAQAFAKVLRALAEDASKRVQVTYATHSPYFVEGRHFEQVRRLVRSNAEPPSVTVHSATIADVKEKVAGALTADQVERQLSSAATGELAVALFASRALIVEGPTDLAVLYGIGDRQSIAGLESRGVAIVPANGKASIPLAHAILTKLGIPAYAVFDVDAEAAPKDRNTHSTQNRRLLAYFGQPEEDFPAESVLDDVAFFGDCLETFLATEWPEWLVACKRVEAAAGISLEKNKLAYRTATLESEGAVPSMLQEVLGRAEGREPCTK
ncbi:ATP-dependent endonuclease [Arthrobacter pityocampae]|uniref:ATP-dependent endonuclease n=1 Tax=Arthrobacter pityocampae TaxID=547334 RepID=A0A2S5IUZ9_9MICC|nr:ATP-dependent endonuclease [Arthrobacter pityocampae]PPB48371.1 ATP-dependent endonuclease [Arthrobacter pityocampae]